MAPRTAQPETFGERMAALRRARGMTQRELAPRIGISNRMVAYYEKQAERPPAHVLDKLAKALHVSADELLGIKKSSVEDPGISPSLLKRLKQIDQLPAGQRKAILQIIDGLLEQKQLGRPRSA